MPTKRGGNSPKYKKFDVNLPQGPLWLYASPAVLKALREVTTDLTLYGGVRLAQVMKAVYEQGLKDGRREVVEKFDAIKKGLRYLPPGRPKRK